MIRLFAFLALAAATITPLAARPPEPPKPRVALNTSEGTIVIELEAKRAPITAANFLAYVDQKRLDGTSFYRAAKNKVLKGRGFIQGGIRHQYTRMLLPIAHEPTTKTGLAHLDGTISMARAAPGTAMGDFFIAVGAIPSMDAAPGPNGGYPGYAAFGRVVSGMNVVQRILAGRIIPGAGAGAMKDQYLARPVTIRTARRVG